MSEAMTNGTTIHLGETSFKDTVVSPDLNNPMRYRWIRPPQEDLMKREDDNYLSSTLLDLSQVWILEPSSRAAETQAPTRVVKIDDRYICSICLKTHARPSRAIACENGHIGYQPFVCDGACGDPVCCAAFANKEHLQNHKLPYEKTHVACRICGKHGWRRNAERHLRSCLNRHKPEIDDQN
ncbi:hypothetical protein FS842_011403 [Serendipita sp. 407]|nr:hypothetical protein FS842_011403 [Serendipita sp. 407]